MSAMKRPWPVLFLCCILAFNASGLAFGLGAIFTDIMDTFRASRASAALVQSLCGGIGFGAGVYLPFYLLSYTFVHFSSYYFFFVFLFFFELVLCCGRFRSSNASPVPPVVYLSCLPGTCRDMYCTRMPFGKSHFIRWGSRKTALSLRMSASPSPSSLHPPSVGVTLCD